MDLRLLPLMEDYYVHCGGSDMRFLADAHPWYDYMDATVFQGLKLLGHEVYGLGENQSNYLIPYKGGGYDVFIQTVPFSAVQRRKGIPKILVWGADTGQGRDAFNIPNFQEHDFDAAFIRDYRGGGPANVFPLHFGIEKRYYCATGDRPEKLLSEREIDVAFLGRYDDYPKRIELLKKIKDAFSNDYNVLIDGHRFNKADNYWTKWVNGHCCHCPDYFEALQNTKIIVSPMGAGPDCARHWEAFASGGVPLVEFMPIVYIPPAPVDGMDWVLFRDPKESVIKIKELLSDLPAAQRIAYRSFETGKKYHTTEKRAQYILDIMLSLKLI